MSKIEMIRRRLWLREYGYYEKDVIRDQKGEYVLEVVEGDKGLGSAFSLSKIYLPTHLQKYGTNTPQN